jgi:integral membrane protein
MVIVRIGTVFSLSAKFEAFTWAGLLVGMYFKYVAATSDAGVWLFGRLHGGAFIVYFFVTIVASFRLRWPWWASVLAITAALPPLVTYALEVWFRRRGLLGETLNVA